MISLLDGFLSERSQEVEKLSVKLASIASVVRDDQNDIDETHQSTCDELNTNLDQLLEHCSQTKVCITV